MRRIAAGDQTAVQDCLDAYGGLVWSLARQLAQPAEAEDAVQEIFIDVWRSAARYDEACASEVAFIAMIARRRLIDRLRRASRQPAVTYLDDMTVEPGTRQDREVEICAEAALAARALQQLRPEQQKVIQLAVYQGLSHQEIARATGMPLGTVKTHVRRGLLHIRQALGLNLENAKEASL